MIPRTLLKNLDQRVELSLDWAGFEKFLEVRGDAAGTRLTSCDGRLEIMSPAENHVAIRNQRKGVKAYRAALQRKRR